jgi:HSP20 family protein
MNTTKTQGTAITPRRNSGLTRWSLWNEMAELRREMDELFNRSFGYPTVFPLLPEEPVAYEPAIDLYSTGDKLVLYAALPGFTAENVEIEADANSITVKGERKAWHDADKAIPEQQAGVSSDRRFNVVCTLPAEINPNEIKATFKDGILNIEIHYPTLLCPCCESVKGTPMGSPSLRQYSIQHHPM